MADGFSLMIGGLQGVFAKIEEVAAQGDLAAKTIVTRGAALMEKEAKANFSGAHKKGQPHVGGDKPNVVTGTLRRSIRSAPVTRLGMAEYGTSVSPSTVYARRVELGYRGSKGYPYFRPAAEKVRPQLEALAKATWAQFLHP